MYKYDKFQTKCGMRSKLPLRGTLFIRTSTSQSRAQIRKLPVHDHTTHVVKIDSLTFFLKNNTY